MPVYATPADVRAVWDGDATDDRLNALLNRAESILAVRVTDLATRLTEGTTSAAMLPIVISNVVARFLNNPRGYAGEHAGEVGYYFAQGSKNAAPGKLAFTDADLADLGISSTYTARSVRVSVPRQWGQYWGTTGLREGECW